ncbi:MAG: hypothetical protein JWM69_1720 [Candidatus Binatus sp.]|nr:hypothetical protein [Candidatus Binatus sp.]
MRISLIAGVILILAASGSYRGQAIAGPAGAPVPSASAPRATGPASVGADAIDAEESGDEKTGPPTPAQKKFGERLVQVIQAKDEKGLNNLLAPETRACLEKTDQNFVKRWTYKQLRFGVTPGYQLSVEKVSEDATKDSQFRTYPLHASHELNIKYLTAEGSEITLIKPIGLQHGNWYLVAACPTAAGVARLHKTEQMRDEAHKRAAQIYPKMPAPLSTRLQALIANGKREQAMRVCAQSMKVDVLTAQQLLAMLESSSQDKKQ